MKINVNDNEVNDLVMEVSQDFDEGSVAERAIKARVLELEARLPDELRVAALSAVRQMKAADRT